MKNQTSTFLQSRIDAKDFPSAVYLVAEKGEIVFRDALGFAVVEPEKIEAKILGDNGELAIILLKVK